MNMRHQAYKLVKKCNYWGPIFETESSIGSNWVSVPNFEATAPTVAEIWRYIDFSTWRPPPPRHLGFFKFQIFNNRMAQWGRTESLCQIWSKSVKPRPRYGDFSIFSRWRPPPSWIFSDTKFLTVERLKRAELRRSAKFGRNRSNRGRDMAIFRLFKMAAASILDF